MDDTNTMLSAACNGYELAVSVIRLKLSQETSKAVEHRADASENAFVSGWGVFGHVSDVGKVDETHVCSHGRRRSVALAVVEEQQRTGDENHLLLRLEERLELLQTLDELQSHE